MEGLLGWARKTIQDQFDFLSDCRRRFAALVDYYCYRGNGGVVSPSEFFGLWTEMCSDFKEAWKVEQQIVAKRIYEEKRGTLKKLKKSNLERVNVKKSSSSSALKKMLTSRGPFSIKKRRSTDDFQKVRDTTDYEKLVSVLTDPDST